MAARSWVCPECGRQFARSRQSHECAPAMTVGEYMATGPPFERPVFEAVYGFITTELGPVHVEPVSVGIFLKRSGSWVELRPLTRWVAMSFPLARTVRSSAIARKPVDTGRHIWHWVNLASPDDLTDEVRDLLAESYALDP